MFKGKKLSANMDCIMGKIKHKKFKYVYYLNFTNEIILLPWPKHNILILDISKKHTMKIPIMYLGAI